MKLCEPKTRMKPKLKTHNQKIKSSEVLQTGRGAPGHSESSTISTSFKFKNVPVLGLSSGAQNFVFNMF